MPDPLTPIESFAERGLAWAHGIAGTRSVVIGGTTYRGTRTELTVGEAEVQHGGRKRPRAFSILIPKGNQPGQWNGVAPKDGTEVTDDLGRKYATSEIKEDAVQVTLTCVGPWG